MQSTKVFIFRNNPTVVPGSIITLRMDAEKVEEEFKPKEKIDWETTVSKELATLISTMSVIMLLRSL